MTTALPVSLGPHPAPAPSPKTPWPGPAAYEETAHALFNGREAEAGELLNLAMRYSFSVLYGKSGIGKSSLLQAGLFPKLRDEGFLPVYVRLDYAADASPLTEQLLRALTREIVGRSIQAPPPVSGADAWTYLFNRDTDLWGPRNRLVTPVIVLDQFEELFTLAPRTRNAEELTAFAAHLGDLIERRVPAELLTYLEKHLEEADRYLLSKDACHVLLSFREDFLVEFGGALQTMRAAPPARMRLTPMKGDRASEAIAKSGAAVLQPATAEKIVRVVAGRDPDDTSPLALLTIEPALLSVMCTQLNAQRIADDRKLIDESMLRQRPREILKAFYDECTRGVTPPVRAFIEEKLLTERGSRFQYPLDDALAYPGVTAVALRKLVTERLLRLDDTMESRRIELTHDVLAPIVKASRDERWAAAAQAAQTRRRRRQWATVAGVGVIGLTVGLFSVRLAAVAERERAAAAAARDTALTATRAAHASAESARVNGLNWQRLYENLDAYKRQSYGLARVIDSTQRDLESRLARADSVRASAVAETQLVADSLYAYRMALLKSLATASPEEQKVLRRMQVDVERQLAELGRAQRRD